MDIIISNNSNIPLYEQVSSQIKEMILTGQLQQEELLPSIRVLAKELKVSIITIKRAYEDLEKENYITTIAGKGTYVSAIDLVRLKEARLSQIEAMLEEVVKQAKAISLTYEELEERLKLIYEEV